MLFRFRAQQAASLGILDLSRTRRPRAITTVTSIPICEKWRGQVLKEISRKVSKIQEPSLSDFQIRDLNDEINKLMREKHMWEVQIRTLGGPNYMRGGGRVVDEEGKEIEGAGRGYRFVNSFFLSFRGFFWVVLEGWISFLATAFATPNQPPSPPPRFCLLETLQERINIYILPQPDTLAARAHSQESPNSSPQNRKLRKNRSRVAPIYGAKWMRAITGTTSTKKTGPS
jgi:hypothetical protein